MTEKQPPINWTRGAQLSVLRQVKFSEFYELDEGSERRKVRSVYVASVLRAIDDFAREISWCTASYPTLATHCHCSRTQVTRAITVLDQLGLIVKQTYRDAGGHRRTKIRIHWDSVLAMADISDQERDAIRYEFATFEHERRSSSTASQIPHRGSGSQSQVPLGGSGPVPQCESQVPHDETLVPHGGLKTDGKRTGRERIKRRDPEARVTGLGAIFVEGSDGEESFQEALDSILRVVPCSGPQDISDVRKIATLAATGHLSPDNLHEAIESTSMKRPANPIAWFISCIKNRIHEAGGNYRDLKQRARPPELIVDE